MPEFIGLQPFLAFVSGGFAGFSLGLIGGGGSVLAVPLLIYFVGMKDAHLAIGTSALAVSLNALTSLIPHARAGHVRWRSAAVFAVTGIVGAFGGSTLGKILEGPKLLFLFALVMMAVAVLMLRPRTARGGEAEDLCLRRLVPLAATGVLTGGLSGFFGIGGGFLIVPGLVFATGMPIIEAIGTSLVSVWAFGLTTAGNYALSGYVDWAIALDFIAGGVAGGWGGMLAAKRLSRSRQALNIVFAVVVFSVGVYMLVRNLGAFA
jgi:uncharacterized membrane protein YfcA